MNLASIDVSKFQAHNTRKACHVPLTSIMKAASWKSADVFSKFYNKPVATENRSFEEAILHDVNDQ